MSVGSAVVILREEAADLCRYPERAEVVAGDELALRVFQPVGRAGPQPDLFDSAACRDRLKKIVPATDFQVEPPGNDSAAPTAGAIKGDELAGSHDREGSQHECVEHGKDRSVHADTDGEREDGGGGESGAAAEAAEGIARIAESGLHPRQAAAVPVVFLGLGYATEFADRGGVRGFRRHTRRTKLGLLHGHVAGDFIVQIALQAPQTEQGEESGKHRHSDSAGFRNRCMIATVLAHSWDSREICFRPARVSS
jgi:hypothetical protein